ncbi:hypothetical protein [Bacillus sp. 71mf]|nr:hypothetical protein [Bacillus sp. 71mf]
MQGFKQKEKVSSGHVVFCVAATYKEKRKRLAQNKRGMELDKDVENGE